MEGIGNESTGRNRGRKNDGSRSTHKNQYLAPFKADTDIMHWFSYAG